MFGGYVKNQLLIINDFRGNGVFLALKCCYKNSSTSFQSAFTIINYQLFAKYIKLSKLIHFFQTVKCF